MRDGKNLNLGYGVYNYSPTRWFNADGYLPALVSSFTSGGATVSITNFADRDVIGGHPYVVVYSRVQIHNPTGHAIRVAPQPTTGLTPLNQRADTVPARTTVDHDYAVAADPFIQRAAQDSLPDAQDTYRQVLGDSIDKALSGK